MGAPPGAPTQYAHKPGGRLSWGTSCQQLKVSSAAQYKCQVLFSLSCSGSCTSGSSPQDTPSFISTSCVGGVTLTPKLVSWGGEPHLAGTKPGGSEHNLKMCDRAFFLALQPKGVQKMGDNLQEDQ